MDPQHIIMKPQHIIKSPNIKQLWRSARRIIKGMGGGF